MWPDINLRLFEEHYLRFKDILDLEENMLLSEVNSFCYDSNPPTETYSLLLLEKSSKLIKVTEKDFKKTLFGFLRNDMEFLADRCVELFPELTQSLVLKLQNGDEKIDSVNGLVLKFLLKNDIRLSPGLTADLTFRVLSDQDVRKLKDVVDRITHEDAQYLMSSNVFYLYNDSGDTNNILNCPAVLKEFLNLNSETVNENIKELIGELWLPPDDTNILFKQIISFKTLVENFDYDEEDVSDLCESMVNNFIDMVSDGKIINNVSIETSKEIFEILYRKRSIKSIVSYFHEDSHIKTQFKAIEDKINMERIVETTEQANNRRMPL